MTAGTTDGDATDDVTAGAGGGPPCAICARTGQGPRRLLHLTHGVSVWLCHTHASDKYLREDEGTVFAERLLNMWLAPGA